MVAAVYEKIHVGDPRESFVNLKTGNSSIWFGLCDTGEESSSTTCWIAYRSCQASIHHVNHKINDLIRREELLIVAFVESPFDRVLLSKAFDIAARGSDVKFS